MPSWDLHSHICSNCEARISSVNLSQLIRSKSVVKLNLQTAKKDIKEIFIMGNLTSRQRAEEEAESSSSGSAYRLSFFQLGG